MGKKSAKAPDYTELARTSREAVQLGRELGNRQLDFAERQYEEMAPIARDISGLQMEAQRQQMEQAEDYYNYQRDTFRPLERGLVADAEAFDTQSYRDRMAGQAAAAAGRAFSTQSQMQRRADAARGLNPNSPAARMRRDSLGLAAARSNAMTEADTRADQLGWARRLDAAGLGRGLAGASSAAYGGATGAGSAAMGTARQPGADYMAGMGQAGGMMMNGYSTGMQGMQGVLNAQTSVYGADQERAGAVFGGLMGLGGAALGAWSDRRLKKDIVPHHYDENLGLQFYEFSYITDPDRRFIGVMADEVIEQYPDVVHEGEDGYLSVDYAELGVPMREITGEAV